MVRSVLALLCLLCVTATGQADAAGASLTAAVDRKELYQNEHVVLTLSLTDSDTRLRAEGVSPNVDLTLLADQFELGVPRADFRFNVARTERRSTSDITIGLFPRRSGHLTIPSFTVDGLSTRPIVLRVLPLPADASPEVFARSGVTRSTLHVGEQTLLYLDLYYRTEIKTAELGGSLETAPLQIEAHALPNAERSEHVSGLEYNVTRTAWAVSPQIDAPVTFFLPSLWIETRAGKQWRLPAQEQRLAVRPLPGDLPGGALAAPARLSRTPFEPAAVGRILPWRITLRAAAGLNTLPERLPLPSATDAFKIYFDPPHRRLETGADGGVDSIAEYVGYLMPLAAGSFATPALELSYFDAEHGAIKHAVLPAETLRIAPGEAPAEGPSLPAAETAASPRTAAAAEPPAPAPWRSATIVFLIAWLITLALWWRQSLRPANTRRKPIGSPPLATARGHAQKQRLLAALGDARTLEQGLRDWERRHGADPDLRAAVLAVQRLCYRPAEPGDEQRAAEIVDHAIAGMREPAAGETGTIDPWSPAAFQPAQHNDTGR
ncbi:MAG: BatD family protein [Gammaproteobacteria bacterium]|nr:BatD family protein [Gammaproteobacteria bacterium]